MANSVEIVVSDKYVDRGGFAKAEKQVERLGKVAKDANAEVADLSRTLTNGLVSRGTTKAADQVEGLGDAARKAGKETETAAKGAAQAIDGVGEAADGAARKASGIGDGVADGVRKSVPKAKAAGEAAGRAAGEAVTDAGTKAVAAGESRWGDAFEGVLGPLGSLGGMAAAAGAAAAGALTVGFQNRLQVGDATVALNTQVGLTEFQAGRSGQVAGQLYSEGLGEGIGDVAAVVGNVGRSFRGLADDSKGLEDVSRRALVVSQVFGEDVNRVVRSTGQLLRNGLAPDAKTALDIIATGYRENLDVAGDFLDTIDEYSPYFARLGLDATTALGLVNQMLQAGARDSDYAADAIKEFTLRAIDGSKSTVNAYKDLGLSADEMAQKIAKGGPTAAAAFMQIIEAIRKVEDPIKQNEIGVGLFGTKWEDTVRDVLPNIDLTRTGFEEVAGSVDKMNESIKDSDSTALKQFTRDLESAANATVEGAVAFSKWTDDQLRALNGVIGINKATDENSDKIAHRNELLTKSSDIQGRFNNDLNNANIALNNGSQTAGELSHAYSSLFDSQIALVKGNGLLAEAQGHTLDSNRSNYAAFLNLSAAGYQVASSLADAATQMDDAAVAATGATVRTDALGRSIISIPGQKPITITADTLQADPRLQGVINRLAAIQSKTVTISINEIRTAQEYSSSVGGRSGQAHGGVTGAGYERAWERMGAAATGGARGGGTVVNEQGPEAIRLPSGSTVIPAGMTKALEQRWLGGAGGAVTLVVESGGSRMDDLLVEIIRRAVVARGGGDVQRALGGRG